MEEDRLTKIVCEMERWKERVLERTIQRYCLRKWDFRERKKYKARTVHKRNGIRE